MDEMYEYIGKKLDEMLAHKAMTVEIDFANLAKMYQLVCYMKQIRRIINDR